MKRWLIYAAAIVLTAVTGYMPFSGSDVGELRPVELIKLSLTDGVLTVQTDTGDIGRGEDVTGAFADLKRTTAGEVFLDTADFLLIEPDALPYLTELTQILRPACKACVVSGEVDLSAAAEFLRIQGEDFTLQNYRAGERDVPCLAVSEERMYIVSKES